LPPMVSAVKVGGRRLHELAREGLDVERAPRPVRIDRFDVEQFVPGPYPEATVLVECGSGTYIRSLAADLGVALGGCAHLGSLRRLRVGSFGLDEARPLDAIVAAPEDAVLPLTVMVRDLARVDIDAEQVRAVSHGMVFPAGALGEGALGEGALGEEADERPIAVVDRETGHLVAVYERRGAACKPAVVIGQAVVE